MECYKTINTNQNQCIRQKVRVLLYINLEESLVTDSSRLISKTNTSSTIIYLACFFSNFFIISTSTLTLSIDIALYMDALNPPTERCPLIPTILF